jgi:hypothetical protein
MNLKPGEYRMAMSSDGPYPIPEHLRALVEAQQDTVSATLESRGTQYGEFVDGAIVMQELKMVIASQLGQRGKALLPIQQEALDMICHKIGRIINGNANNIDSWLDIAGYARLVYDHLVKESKRTR